MPNPMFNNSTSPNNATAPSNSVNESHKRYNRSHNSFDFSRIFYNTLRYADVTPFESVEGVEGDRLPFGSTHEIRTHTLSSPLMSKIFMKKQYFQIDMKGILPVNWEKIYTNPVQGDDVPDDAFCYIPNFIGICSDFTAHTLHSLNLLGSSHLLKRLILLESIFSNGSLLSSLGYHFSPCIYSESNSVVVSFDKAFDNLFSQITSNNNTYRLETYDGNFYFIGSDNSHINWRTALDIIRHRGVSTFSYFDGEDYINEFSPNDLRAIDNFFYCLHFHTDSFHIPLNLSRIVAYQLICSQFYTNDKIDSIFSSHLWLENQKSIYRYDLSGVPRSWPSFTYNGSRVDYDVISSHVFVKLWNYIISERPDEVYLDYFLNIFTFRSSLRYGDYFTGSRSRPLAIGDVTSEVSNSSVSAIDITRSIMIQRFLNSVNRVGRRFSDYLSGVMNGVAPPDSTEPRYLASVTSRVSGFEVENTSSDQGDIVTLLKSGDSNYIYEVEVGSPCIIMGLCTFEVQRVYSRSIDRFNFHSNRFEWFNKFMQYIGDQDIKQSELSSSLAPNFPFAYTSRYMEYKQRYPVASGGFVEYLPSWLFITDNLDKSNSNTLNINSSFIRSKNEEFDRFYKSLTGYSLASYFHFICSFDNKLIARREMDYSPSIL